MGEHLADVLLKAGDALHWLGQYQVANACILVSRLARARNLDTLDALEAFVAAEETSTGKGAELESIAKETT